MIGDNLSSLEARTVVLARIHGGSCRPVRQAEADEMLDMLGCTVIDAEGRVTLLGHSMGVLVRWHETVGVFLPRKEVVIGASRIMPDRARFLGWAADVAGMLIAADGAGCPGGSGQAVMDALGARSDLDYLRNVHASTKEIERAEKRMRSTSRLLARKVGLAWLTCLPRMGRL